MFWNKDPEKELDKLCDLNMLERMFPHPLYAVQRPLMYGSWCPHNQKSYVPYCKECIAAEQQERDKPSIAVAMIPLLIHKIRKLEKQLDATATVT